MDTDSYMDSLKRDVFHKILNMAGRVYILVRYSEGVKLGNRGFNEEEQNNGIVLVFNTHMNINWTDGAIKVKLSFGTTVERCYIPSEDITLIFSPDINVRLIVGDRREDNPSVDGTPQLKTKSKTAKSSAEKKGGKVIEVDFTKKRK